MRRDGVGLVATLVALCLGLTSGCSDAQIDPPELTLEAPPAPLVEDLMKRHDADEETAIAIYEQTLRLSDAFRAAQASEASEQFVDPQARVFRERATLAYLWLDRVFEPTHGLDSMPAEAFAKERETVEHPKLAAACQLIAMPRGLEGEARAEVANSPEFQARATPLLEDFTLALEPLRAEGVAVDDCLIFVSLAGAFANTHLEHPDVNFKVERSVYPVCTRGSLVDAWVDSMCGLETPGLVPPFVSPFGVHLVHVQKIVPATSGTPESYDRKAREAALDRWRTEELREEIDRLAGIFDVLVFASSEGPAASGQP